MLKWVALIWILKSKNFVRWGARKAENYRKRDPNVQKQAGDSLNNESQTDNSLSIYLVLGTARGDLNLHKTLDGNYSYLHFIEGKLEAQRGQVTFPKLTKHFNAELADPKPTLSGEKAPFSGTRSWERISVCLFVCLFKWQVYNLMSGMVRSYRWGFGEILFRKRLWHLCSLFAVPEEAGCFCEAERGEF